MKRKIQILPALTDLWCEPYPAALTCCQCKEKLNNEPLARTFRQYDTGNPIKDEASEAASKVYHQVLGTRIEVFDRHLRCLSGVQYVTVSHVWDPLVAIVQYMGRSFLDPKTDAEVREKVCESIVGIVRGLKGHMPEGTEVWHDYISVPQWCYKIKSNILAAIPRIFGGAQFTLIFMRDVSAYMVWQVEHGSTSQERIKGITGICNDRWYKRVWTSMEYVRSRHLKVMVQDFHVEESRPNIFKALIEGAWNKELADHGWDVHKVEALAEMGENMVPWNLGLQYLHVARGLERIDFGLGYAVLSRRGCQNTSDFFHALLGFLKIELDEPIEMDELAALRQIAMACMIDGDYSPLFMAPNMESLNPQVYYRKMKNFGYFDAWVFGLGMQTAPSEFHAESIFQSTTAKLKLERIGTVNYLGKPPRGIGAKGVAEFAWTAGMVLGFTGPNVDDFVNTIAGRLSPVPKETLAGVLADPVRRRAIQKLINEANRSRSSPSETLDMKIAQPLADAMGLTVAGGERLSPLQYLDGHGGTMHMFPFEALVWADCPDCFKCSIYRSGFYHHPKDMRDAVAYRIPGLKYETTSQDGVGIIMKDGLIVGRLCWATRSCSCRQTEMVEVGLGNLYLPVQRDKYLKGLDSSQVK